MSQHWNYLDPAPTYMDRSLIKACYRFDGPDLGLTDRTPNGNNLVKAGTVAGASWMPCKAEYGCNCAFLTSIAWLQSTPSATLGTLGPATLEMVFLRNRFGSLDDTYNFYVFVGGPTETEADNIIFSIYGSANRNRLGILVERGGGTNVATTSPGYWQVGLAGHMMYYAIVRLADGVTYKVYVDGEYLEDIVLANPPTGGTNVGMNINGSSTGNSQSAAYNSVRFSHVALEPYQIKEEYYSLRRAA